MPVALAAPVGAEPLDIPGDNHGNMSLGNDAPLSAPDGPAPAPTQPLPGMAADFDPANLSDPAPALIRVTFEEDSASLSDAASNEIKSFAYAFKESGGRVSLKGYAGMAGSTGSNERRLSLRRVLMVRDVLLAEGIKSDRMDVRALGGVRDNGPTDRVDITKSGR